MPETEMAAGKRNDGWWISFVLRWSLFFSVDAAHVSLPTPAGQAIVPFLQSALNLMASYNRGVQVAVGWFAAHAFGLQIQGGEFWGRFSGLAVAALGAIPFALIWTIFDRRTRSNEVLREGAYLLVRYTLAAAMFNYGTAKLALQQGIAQPAQLDWFRPLGEISTGNVMWTWLGYSRTFEFFAGVNETVGAILLLFRRTTLFGALLILPVMAYVTALDMTFHVGPQAAAAIYTVAAFYLVVRERRRLAGAFLLGKPTAPPPPKKLWTSPRLGLVGRLLWVVVVAFTLRNYALPHSITKADIGGRQSALCGAYQVERFVIDGRVLPEESADPARWRVVSINWFADFIRIRRMDNSELLWSADPGDPYRFLVAQWKPGDYGKILAKTASMQGQLRFKELQMLPDYGSAPAFLSHLAEMKAEPWWNDTFFILNYVRNSSDQLSLQVRFDGAEISADLRRIDNDSFAFFRSRGKLP